MQSCLPRVLRIDQLKFVKILGSVVHYSSDVGVEHLQIQRLQFGPVNLASCATASNTAKRWWEDDAEGAL